MYCPECGTKIEETGCRFCPECGTKLSDDKEESATVEQTRFDADIITKDSEEDSYLINGILFTNLVALSAKLGTSEVELTNLLNQYIAGKKKYGVAYKLIDAGRYTFHKKNFLGMSKTVHLDTRSSLQEYMDILADAHANEENTGMPLSEYLFIIGGDDIIPMPAVKHFNPQGTDKTIDTDILYSYPQVENMLDKLSSFDLFGYEQLFHVGRLPIEKDTTMNELANYLSRSLQYSSGIPIGSAYGQCDPNWRMVSSVVSSDLTVTGLLPDIRGRFVDGVSYNRLFLSPLVTLDNVSQVFNPKASLYYLNLHGSGALDEPNYWGQELRGEQFCPALSPSQLGSCSNPNVVVCEACYGARFIDEDKKHSMLLSAIYNQTMAFIGSSRIAWGMVDPVNCTDESQLSISYADTIAYFGMRSLLEGYSVGQALWIARNQLFNLPERESPIIALTAVEFNLFGDPTLFLVCSEQKQKLQKEIDLTRMKNISPLSSCKMEVVFSEDSNEKLSLLNQVRQAVDKNIMTIHEMVAEYLYKNYNLPPRPVSSVVKLVYQDGRKKLWFTYNSSSKNSMHQSYTVTTNLDGTITNVMSTR